MDLLIGTKTITHSILTCSAVLAMTVRVNFIREQDIVFNSARIIQGEIWRVFSGLFFLGKFDFDLIQTTFMYASPLLWHESEFFITSRAFVWRLLLISAMSLAASLYWQLRMPGLVVLIAFSYLAGRRNPNDRVAFFNLPLPAGMFPYNQIAMSSMLGMSLATKQLIVGSVIGHIILVLDDILPNLIGRHLIALPNEREL